MGFFVSVFSRLIDWIIALYIRPSIKVTQFDIEETENKELNISFSAFISNNTSKTFYVSQNHVNNYNDRIATITGHPKFIVLLV